jgi:hypothetical protein
VVDGSLPVCMWNWNSLIVRDGYQRHISILVEKLPQIRRMHHSVHRGDCGDFISARQREMDIVAVKVNHVELTYALSLASRTLLEKRPIAPGVAATG